MLLFDPNHSIERFIDFKVPFRRAFPLDTKNKWIEIDAAVDLLWFDSIFVLKRTPAYSCGLRHVNVYYVN